MEKIYKKRKINESYLNTEKKLQCGDAVLFFSFYIFLFSNFYKTFYRK